MVTSPNWMAPFHIARAIPTPGAVCRPLGYPALGVWTVTIPHARKARSQQRGLATYHERIDSDGLVRRRPGRADGHGMGAARRRVPGEDDLAARGRRCLHADDLLPDAIDRDSDRATFRALRRDDGKAAAREGHRELRARARGSEESPLVRRGGRQLLPVPGPEDLRAPVVVGVIAARRGHLGPWAPVTDGVDGANAIPIGHVEGDGVDECPGRGREGGCGSPGAGVGAPLKLIPA